MKKEEFLKKLSEKLSILNEDEVKDILEEYSEHIDEKLKTKKKEEKIIEEFGDIDELASEILKAYKINDNYKKNDFNSTAKKYFDGFENVLTTFVKKLTHSSFGEIIKFIIELFIICLLIALVKIPFSFVEDCLNSIFNNLIGPFDNILSTLFTFVIEILYLVVAFFMFITIFKERYVDGNVVFDEKESKESEVKSEKKSKEVVKSKKISKEKGNSAFDTLANIMFVIGKIVLVFISIPFICTFIFSVIAFVVSILFSIEYTLILGIVVFCLGAILGHVWLITIIYNFIFNKANKGKTLFILFLASIILMGTGIGYAALEFSRFDYKDVNTLTYDTKEYNYSLDRYDENNKLNIICYECEEEKIVLDNTLDNNVKIRIGYANEFIDLDLDQYDDFENNLHIYPELNGKKTFDFILNSFKEKAVYNLEDLELKLTIYVSETNKNKISLYGE